MLFYVGNCVVAHLSKH